MSLTSRIAAGPPARVADGEAAASSSPSSVLVVGDSAPHTRTVQREVASVRTLASGRTAITFSPFTRRALAGELPTHRDLPMED